MMKRILIVDDDEGVQDSLSMIFGPPEYIVTILPNGKRILSGEFDQPDIFIIDKQLPGVDGLELCKHLKFQQPFANTPIIIMSANPHAAILAKTAGADGFIEKPYKIKDLKELINRHLK